MAGCRTDIHLLPTLNMAVDPDHQTLDMFEGGFVDEFGCTAADTIETSNTILDQETQGEQLVSVAIHSKVAFTIKLRPPPPHAIDLD